MYGNKCFIAENIKNMRKFYHLCLSSPKEVLYRNEEDFIRGFNCFAEAAVLTESRVLADGEMTTHNHFGVCTDDPQELMFRNRYAYSSYFNAKYHRKGRLGEKYYFADELEGTRRIVSALSYIMRQGVHHGLTSTPFEYPHCSANVIFQKEMGRKPEEELMPACKRHKYLSRNSCLDDGFRMSSSGLLLREDIVDVHFVEELYITSKGFIYNMIRKSGTDWENEQKEESPNLKPVTLETIECGCSQEQFEQLKRNESGRPDKSRMTDLDLCKLIDNVYVPQISKDNSYTIYDLSEEKRRYIGNLIWQGFKSGKLPFVTSEQIGRCLGGL